MNINSVRHKFDPLREALNNSVLDVLLLQETKLDESFPKCQFEVSDYMMYRCDYKHNSGGLMTHIRNDIPQRRRFDLEICETPAGRIELLVVEINFRNEKWIICNLYKQPGTPDNRFVNVYEILLCNIIHENVNIVIAGDFNVNMANKNNCLIDILDVNGMQNIIKDPTCFKSDNPTLIDLVTTNIPKRFKPTCCVESALSDFHKMICFATKMHAPTKVKRKVTYRSYKHFNEIKFKQDLSVLPFHVSEVFDCIDDSYWYVESLIKDIIDEHAPLKTRIIRHKQVPYMNSELRRAINVRNMLHRKFNKCKSTNHWNAFKKQRNIVTKLRKKSIGVYLKTNCNVNNGKLFWDTVKPLISDKAKNNNTNISLLEENNIVNQSIDVANIFNEYYVNVTKEIGEVDTIYEHDDIESILETHLNHDAVKYITEKCVNNQTFSFNLVSQDHIYTKLCKTNVNKATGWDSIPPKLIKLGAESLCVPIHYLVNKSIQSSVFPDSLKRAEVIPIFKKDDMLVKKNYRPVSVLPCLSKVFESILIEQMTAFFDSIFSKYMSGFRKNHNCQDVLIRLVENCKTSLDNNKVNVVLLTDLSKAFDSLPHRLLLSKLKAYGLNTNACTLVSSYFRSRKQRVKIGNTKSEWLNVLKGAPQGSLFGPFAYNVFSNDLLMLLSTICDIYNYADDNSISCEGDDYDSAHQKILQTSNVMLNWFKENYLQANPSKFQFIVFDKRNMSRSIQLDDHVLMSEKCVKLLGVNIDSNLNFSNHISIMCKKAGKQLNVLARLSVCLDVEAKILLSQTFILSHFNYCPIVWHFCTREDLRKIEKIQKRALRYIYNDYTASYSDLRRKADTPLLYTQRLKQIMLQVYKSTNSLGPKYLHDMFEIKTVNYNLRNTCNLKQPKFNTVKYGKLSLSYEGPALWNILDNQIKESESLNIFKEAIKQWPGISCNCSVCSTCILNNM